MNWLDHAIETVAPVTALRRKRARLAIETVQDLQNSGYSHSGASHFKKAYVGWDDRSFSPQEDIDYNLDTLRQRSRDLYMSAPIATSAIKNNRTNVIGAGLRLKSIIDREQLGLSPEQAQIYQKQFQKEFEFWASSRFCDALRINNFYELQQVALTSWLLNGDAFAVPKYGEPSPAMPYTLRLHLVEADRICTPNVYNQSGSAVIRKLENGNRCYSGVEIDNDGAVIAYHICNVYPSSPSAAKRKWTRVKAFGERTGNPNIIQIMESERCDQYRGVPFLAPVMESLKQMTRYENAEIMAAVICSFFTAFITTDNNPSVNPFGEATPEGQRMASLDDEPKYELGAGTVNVLAPGEKVEFGNPTRPASGFESFMKAIARNIGAALEISAESLQKEFSASYSASRAAFLETWKAFKMRRSWFASDFCQPVYELFLAEAVSLGRVSAPGFFAEPAIRRAWCGAEWNGPAQGQIDTVDEVKASAMKCAYGFSTRHREAMELTGTDYEQNAAQLAREQILLGVPDVAKVKEDKPDEKKDAPDSKRGTTNEQSHTLLECAGVV